jgi:8-oxo-dGTP pyrophosphatase MutT (NUDIX family)
MGLLSWFRKFIEKFSIKVRPLWELFNAPKYEWRDSHEHIYRSLIEELTKAPILGHPNLNKPFTVHTDASGKGLGGMLTQMSDDNKERVIEYASRALNQSELNYPTTDLECLAVKWAVVDKFHYYLGIQPFRLITDHSALINMQMHTNLSANRKRWIAELQQYRFQVEHRKGKDIGPPDTLSRLLPDTIKSMEVWKRPELMTPNQADFVLVVIYDEKVIYLSKRLGKPMQGLLQTPCGKVDPGESSLCAAVRETEEETGIKFDQADLIFVANDPDFNCDLYIAVSDKVPKLTEPTKMDKWVPHTYKQYFDKARQGLLTPSHTKFHEEIMGKILVESLKNSRDIETNYGEERPKVIEPREVVEIPLEKKPWWQIMQSPPPYQGIPQQRPYQRRTVETYHYNHGGWINEPTYPPPPLMTEPYWEEATDDRWDTSYHQTIYDSANPLYRY